MRYLQLYCFFTDSNNSFIYVYYKNFVSFYTIFSHNGKNHFPHNSFLISLKYGEVSQVERDISYDSIFEFRVAPAKDAILKLPFGKVVLKNSKILNSSQRTHAEFCQVE